MSNDLKNVLAAAGVPEVTTLAAAQNRISTTERLLATPGGESTQDLLARQAQPLSRDVRFSPDPSSGEVVVHIIGSNGDVVRQIPSEDAQDMARVLGRLRGAFLADKA